MNEIKLTSAEIDMKAQRMSLRLSEVQPIQKANHTKEPLTDSLMEQICKPSNLNQAYKRVKANKGSPGIDGVSVDELREYMAQHKESLIESLLSGKYRSQPVRQVEIPKANGGVRQLGIPTVIDRLVQQAILQVLQAIFEVGFSNSSYGFRPKRSAHQAIKQAQEYVQAGNKIVVDMDLEKFFDRVNHDILMSRIAKRINDKRLLKIIRSFLEAGIMQNGVCVERVEGTPQGGPLSPLLSNILLDELDKELEKRGHKFCRYADDCNIYVRSQRSGERVLASIKAFLEKKLKLKVNEEKSKVAKTIETKFLGFRILQNGKISLPKETIKRVKDKVREITKRNRGRSMEQVIEEVNSKLRGWLNYYKPNESHSIFSHFDSWLRRKIRCYRWKQLKKYKAKVKFLISLGVERTKAFQTASSRKGLWRTSRLPYIQKAMSNDWFDKQGLINLRKQALVRN